MAGTLFIKLDVNYADDPKIIEVGEKSEILYVRSLCLAKRIMSDGFIADAHLPRFGLSGVNARARKLVAAGLWTRDDERGGYVITAWSRRNPPAAGKDEKASQAAEDGIRGNHKRWHSDRGIIEPTCPLCPPSSAPPDDELVSGDPTEPVSGDPIAPDSGTPEKPHRQSRDRVETEKESKPLARARPKRRIDPGWQPTDDHRSLAAEVGVNCDQQAEQFRDHYIGKGEPRADWDASFRTWLRNAPKFGGKPGGNGRPPPRTQQVSDFSQSAGERFVP